MRRLPLVILFAVLAAATAAIIYVMREPAPEKTLAAAFKKLGESSAVYAKVTAETVAPVALAGGERVPVLIGGAVHANLPADGVPYGEAALVLLGTGDEVREDISVELKAMEKGDAFLKFDALPAGKEGEPSLADLNGQWYSLRRADLGSALIAGSAAGPGLDEDEAKRNWARIRSAVLDGMAFSYGGKLPDEVIDGAKLHRFTLLLNRDAAAGLLKDVRSLALGRALTKEEEGKISETLDSHVESVDVWIDKRTGEFKKMVFESAARENAEANRAVVMVEFFAFSEPAAVEAPVGAKPFSDIASRLKKKTE